MARLRMIAGPNGSGKTTLTQHLRNAYDLDFGYYVNADELETSLRRNGQYSLAPFPLSITDSNFRSFYRQHPLQERSAAAFFIEDNVFHLQHPLPARTYFPTLLADFLREELVRHHKTFSFETVMSDARKVTFLEKARKAGYRNYLYYICTQDPLTNIDRVKDRVQKNGHDVPEDKILERYGRSLENLPAALRSCHRAYLFDNSGAEYRLIAELDDEQLELKSDEIPGWLEKAVLSKL